MPREKYGFLLFDCPSDHEVEGVLSTECDTIRALLSNRSLGTRLKPPIRVSSVSTFKELATSYKYNVQYVHLAGHGSKYGLGLIEGIVPWEDVAAKLTNLLYPLKEGEQRVLCLSCCYSKQACKSMQKRLSGYFTGSYYFSESKIEFATSLTVWSMFYLRKNLSRPHEKIVVDINSYLGDVLAFRRIN